MRFAPTDGKYLSAPPKKSKEKKKVKNFINKDFVRLINNFIHV